MESLVKALLERFDFYDVTFFVALFPKRGWAFDRLECQVELNPAESPQRRPLAHDIFPSSSWETLATTTMHLEMGVTEALEFGPRRPSLRSGAPECRASSTRVPALLFRRAITT